MNLQAKKLAIRHIHINSGISIAFISDIHFDNIIINPLKIINTICEGSPDVIVITGDLCSRLEHFKRVTTFLDMLAYKAGCPILITLGNHDTGIIKSKQCTKNEYIEALESVSPEIHVLENEKFIYKNILFGGLTEIHSNTEDYVSLVKEWEKEAQNKGYKYILLTHNPDIMINIPSMTAVTAILAGHTHGGQVRVPFNIEFTLLKKDVLPKKGIYYGLHNYKGMKLYITSGIGCSLMPIRLRSSAEVVFFD